MEFAVSLQSQTLVTCVPGLYHYLSDDIIILSCDHSLVTCDPGLCD